MLKKKQHTVSDSVMDSVCTCCGLQRTYRRTLTRTLKVLTPSSMALSMSSIRLSVEPRITSVEMAPSSFSGIRKHIVLWNPVLFLKTHVSGGKGWSSVNHSYRVWTQQPGCLPPQSGTRGRSAPSLLESGRSGEKWGGWCRCQDSHHHLFIVNPGTASQSRLSQL